MTALTQLEWQAICHRDDLVPGGGVCALLGQEHVALFYLPQQERCLYALGNYDPIGHASVQSRGIVGSIGEHLVVASPLYKQHFDLVTGECMEDESMAVPVYEVRLDGDSVLIRG